ncbi:hypothetical protein LMG27952_01125 [Paraburkholderia hiiakae]|uniref:Nuclear transport factor 2 family protein n=2 Tax=Paraburkholderia hiiakae TaxID=1081782 RepID=A0ABM8NE44_9BURK|nr:hypothetical protein LMG27952_01125 [Paraburkholderia hiiakae]
MSHAPLLALPLYLECNMKRLLLAALAATSFVTCAHAQSDTAGSFTTPSGTLQFVRDDRDFVAIIDKDIFDRFDAKTLTHFDEIGRDNSTVTRMLVQTNYGPVLYDFRRRPPVVQHVNAHMTVKRVFWQPDEVVMQGPEGWFRFRNGTLTKLQSTTTTYH